MSNISIIGSWAVCVRLKNGENHIFEVSAFDKVHTIEKMSEAGKFLSFMNSSQVIQDFCIDDIESVTVTPVKGEYYEK